MSSDGGGGIGKHPTVPIIEGLDPGISVTVEILMQGGVETFESCQGGEGHAFPEPTVRFHGHHYEGFRALAWALAHGMKVKKLHRAWTIVDGEPTGPQWEMTFHLDDTNSNT